MEKRITKQAIRIESVGRKRTQQELFWELFGSPCDFNLGSLSSSTWHVPETEASHTNLSRVVHCVRGEIHHPREAGPPTPPQREARRPLAQSRPPAAPQKNTRPSQTQFFVLFRVPNHTSTDQVETSRSDSIAVSPSSLPAWGFGAVPATKDIPRKR